jgi:hypothetical protein
MSADKEALQALIDALMKSDVGELVRRAIKAETERSSVEYGTPGKGGVVKVYVDADDPVGAKRKIDNVMQARDHLITKYEGSQ